MGNETMRGIYTIPSTPFHEDGSIDIEGFQRTVEFCVACGAHGLVYPVNASEYTSLSDAERLTLSQALVETAAGRLPTVIGVAATCRENAAAFAAHARSLGATAVIAMPPYVKTKSFSEENTFAYYQAISDAAKIPVFIQNYEPPIGTNMSVDLLLKMCREIEYVQYVKEETLPSTVKLQQLMEANAGECKGVFGGAGCRYLLEEYRRGTAGNMPGCHVTDVCVALWDALEAGDQERAAQIYKDMAPLFFFEAHLSGVYKEVLKLRGVIQSAFTRNNTYQLDKIGMQFLQEALESLKPYMKV
ncbi:MAG: dihydrodipicolinate synthase family protein [Candidatus Limiplasma sp.]|nr:dihydrodipicolinate synthase family protein [Candidatus Limiplasma sp.]